MDKKHVLPLLVCLLVCCLNPESLSAHQADEKSAQTKQPTMAPIKAIRLPHLDGAKPWTDAPHLNDPDRFHIAIMTDRTGGHRPGIWMKGIRAVNLLRPEFVVSVGDLIEGYTEDRQQVEAEWQEFLGMIDQLQMKFFFVAGSHDLTNPMMHKVWRKHFGKEWYSFDYKGVHFICLSSEDPQTHLGEKQLAWLEEDLNQHTAARWTLVFLHKPLWSYARRDIAAGNPDSTGWTQAESLLGARPHTVFAGHTHHYVQFDRNGAKYFQLATTGGGSQLRGKPYGEFDHVMWLTMEKDGPHVANLMLDGVLPGSVVTEKSIARFRNFLAKTVIEIAPIWVDQQEQFSQGRIDLRVTNKFDTPIKLTGVIEGLPLRGLTLDPEQLSLQVEPGKTVELALGLNFVKSIDLTSLAGTRLMAQVKTLGNDRTLSAEWSIPVTIDRKYQIPRRAKPITVDGLLNEWDALRLTSLEDSLVVGSVADWHGLNDASLTFDIASDDNHLCLAGRITDDAVVEGDAVEVWLDARPLPVRAKDRRLRDRAYKFRMSAQGEPIDLRGSPINSPDLPQGTRSAVQRTKTGYEFELALPTELLHRRRADDWQSIQLTVVVHDVDEKGQPTAQVIWRGTQQYDQRNTNYGQFVWEEGGSRP